MSTTLPAARPTPVAVPRLLVLSDRGQAAAAGSDLVGHARAVGEAGADALVLREKDLPRAERRRLAEAVASALAGTATRLLVAGDPELATAVGAAGVHLAANQPAPSDMPGRLVLRSCHDAGEVARTRRAPVDAAVVSPVAVTTSKPGYGPALGRDGLRDLVEVADGLPVLALGGVTPDDVAAWCHAGAHGVAVMGAVMRAPDPAAVVRRLRAALTPPGREDRP
ncbi:thiamine phosphate synthase [Egicoccus sp. AB-alg2]|uniref:thiamine phosphate synthase n=1 Tax=Egicoccus sp. AB-alg2 TaxID=3242693 RepID=UPI00359DE41F